MELLQQEAGSRHHAWPRAAAPAQQRADVRALRTGDPSVGNGARPAALLTPALLWDVSPGADGGQLKELCSISFLSWPLEEEGP